MKKKTFLRALLGIPLGIAMGYLITIGISLCIGQGSYAPCVPALSATMGSEMAAVVVQAALSGLLGAAFAACSVIWEMENWSIAKQTGLYFLITSVVFLPIAYVANWMEHTLAGFLVYFGIFVAIFIVIWLVQYLFWMRKLRKINDKVKAEG